MAPTWVNVAIVTISLMMFGGFVLLFFWLLEGWITPGILWILAACGLALMFVAFGWILLIGLGVIASLVAGIIIGSDANSNSQ
jgi:hypothetical protein